VRIEWVLETHAHADHLSAAPYVKAKTGAKVGIGEHIKEVQKIFRPVFNLTDVSGDGSEFDRLFKHGERFTIGNLEAEVIYVPGHTPADVAYRIEDAVFVGDTLFMPDYGTARADFPGGDARKLYASMQRLLALPDDTRLFMCHDYKAPGRDVYAWETTVQRVSPECSIDFSPAAHRLTRPLLRLTPSGCIPGRTRSSSTSAAPTKSLGRAPCPAPCAPHFRDLRTSPSRTAAALCQRPTAERPLCLSAPRACARALPRSSLPTSAMPMFTICAEVLPHGWRPAA
jgi:glyoxylase-like metal-dependent hydrolase (beta-lactamase superfamily II)